MSMTMEERDLKYIWHPCSQMKDYEELAPMVIDHGKGVWLYDIHGKEYLDIVSSWWCNLFGHCNETINAAIKAQLDQLEHVIFANFSMSRSLSWRNISQKSYRPDSRNSIFRITAPRRWNVR